MRQLIERYLTRLGPARGLVLLGILLVWASIVIAGAVVAVLWAFWIVWELSWAATGLQATDLALATLAWVMVVLSAWLARALLDLWRQWRRQRWNAEMALDAIEERLYPGRSTAYLERVRERLAVRALETMEERVTGLAREADVALETRLVELQAELADPDDAAGG